jgi:hypothetical protein
MPNRTSRKNRHTRSNSLRSSARYNVVNENAELAKAIEESEKTAAYEKKHANLEELAMHKASEESKKLKNLKNSEELAANLQEIENQEAINALRKIHEQENRNLKMARSLQAKNQPKKSFNKNGSFARNLQAKYNMEYAKSIYKKLKPKSVASTPKKESIPPSEEMKESEPPPRPKYYVHNPVRLQRTRSKTISRPMSMSKSSNTKKRRWWPF